MEEIEQPEEGLSYQEKSIIISLIGSVIVYTVFSVLVWQRYQAGGFSSDSASQFLIIPEQITIDGEGNLSGVGSLRGEGTDFDSATVFQFWGQAVLILIGVQIVLVIVGQIVLAIIHTIAAKKDDIPTFEDERDKLIELKAMRSTFIVFGVGFILSMIILAVGGQPISAPVIMLVGMMAADIMGNLSKLYFYRRGY